MNNAELREVLQKDKEKIKVPDKFKPENIEELLQKRDEVSDDVIKASKFKKSRNTKRVIAVASIAAAIVIILSIIPALRRNVVYDYYNELDNGFKQLKSYESLEGYLKAKWKEENRMTLSKFFNELFNVSMKGSSPSVNSDYLSGVSPEYSDTNVRTEGIKEADIIKTNGEYIYSYYEKELTIIKPEGADTSIITKYNIDDFIKMDDFEAELLLYNDRLILIGDEYAHSKHYTTIIVFDSSDVTNLKMIGDFTIEGEYKECRMYDNYLYVGTTYGFNSYRNSDVSPEICGNEMDSSKVFLTEYNDYSSHYIITTFDINDEPKLVDYISVINDGYVDMYMTKESIYLLSGKTKNYVNMYTEILKFAFDDGMIEAKATNKVDGWLEDVFCVDEYNTYLRLVITSRKNNDEINTLYVFDESLEIVGNITDIAPGESIYSARFDGDIGYFVTFEQVDPLFSVDLSNPNNPKIIGKLKIPGFSEYMHIWGEGRMLGIGLINGNLKLSMFDICNPTNVSEEGKLVFENAWYSTALYNHKSVLIDEEKNIIGFDIEGSVYIKNELTSTYGYCIYSYEGEQFVQKAVIEYRDGIEYYDEIRGMYIGEYIYVVVADGHIDVIDMNTFEVICTIK